MAMGNPGLNGYGTREGIEWPNITCIWLQTRTGVSIPLPLRTGAEGSVWQGMVFAIP